MPTDETCLVTFDEDGLEDNVYLGWIDSDDGLFYGEAFEVGISADGIKGWYPIPQF